MEVSNELVCPLCKHVLIAPVILPCCLTATCYECLKRTSYHSNPSSCEVYYNCPFCKKDHENLETVIPSNFLQEYMNDLSRKGISEFIICDRCDNNFGLNELSICYCCGERIFCNNCNDLLHSTGKYTEHIRKPLQLNKALKEGKYSISCKHHVKEKIGFICIKDKSMLCNFCLIPHRQACKNATILTIE